MVNIDITTPGTIQLTVTSYICATRQMLPLTSPSPALPLQLEIVQLVYKGEHDFHTPKLVKLGMPEDGYTRKWRVSLSDSGWVTRPIMKNRLLVKVKLSGDGKEEEGCC